MLAVTRHDRLYPRYELEAKAGETFQQWLKADRRKETAKRVRLVKTSAEYTK